MSTPPESWTPTEQRLWRAVRQDQPLDLRAGADDGGRPLVGDSSETEVSAGVLAALLLLPPAPAAGVVPRLWLTGARITGRLRLPHAEVRIPIVLIGCRFEEPVDLGDAVLRAADFTGCQIPELHADGLRTDGDLALVQLASGKVSLFRAQIGGNLWLNAARIHTGETGFAIHGAQLRIDGGLYANSIHVTGTVNLWGAQAFSAEFTSAHLTGKPLALRGDGLTVTRDLQCSNLLADGGIQLSAASIGGQFWLNKAEVRSTMGWAITAPTATVAGGVYGRGMTADGGVNLFAATVGESIELPATTLRCSHQPALRAFGIRLGGDLMLDQVAQLAGDIDLTRAEIKGTLTMADANLGSGTTISLRHAGIGVFDMTALNRPPAAVDLRAARIATIRDDPRTWPQRFAFDMLTYQALDPVLPAADRLAWLARGSGGYHPQAYEHLATHYRQLGHDRDARAVLVAHHRHRRRTLRPLGRMWGYIEDVVVGYGYMPARALGWLLALTTVLAVVFTAVPARPVQRDGPQFHPIAYAIDLVLPILDLGQEHAFVPEGITQWIAWAGSLCGWLLATTVIAGITRRLTRS